MHVGQGRWQKGNFNARDCIVVLSLTGLIKKEIFAPAIGVGIRLPILIQIALIPDDSELAWLVIFMGYARAFIGSLCDRSGQLHIHPLQG